MTGYAQWMNGKYAATVREIALATRQCQVRMSVEYLAPSIDGRGRLYARQACAQTLPRSLRLLLYGGTRKEVDFSGAHYVLICSTCASRSLPSVSQRRGWLRQLWATHLESASADVIQDAIKLLPIRIINSGYRAAVAYLVELNLPIPAWLHAFAYERLTYLFRCCFT